MCLGALFHGENAMESLLGEAVKGTWLDFPLIDTGVPENRNQLVIHVTCQILYSHL